MAGYYTAQICRNGHVVTNALELIPEASSKFCDECGLATLTTCPHCQMAIRGTYREGFNPSYERPSYCRECGVAFPWMAERLATMRDLITASTAPKDDKDALLADLDAIAADTPRTQIVVMRMKKFLARASDEVVPAVRQIVVEVATSAAKKSLGL